MPERYGRVYKVTAFLVNHEMLCLSIAVSFAFGITMWESEEKWKIYEFLLTLIVPLVLCIIVFLISFSTYNYKKCWSIMVTGGKNTIRNSVRKAKR